MKKISFLILATLLLFSCQSNEKSKELPNIVVVLADDMGYGDISSFNPESKILTPHLDRMAAEGMRFTDAHTSSSVCTPTRYGLLTGRYNWRTHLKSGVLSGISQALIPSDRSTLASMLKTSGYHTAFIGKWHLGWDWAIQNPDQASGEGYDMGKLEIDYSAPVSNGPAELGFDYSYGHCGSLDMAPYVYVENSMVTAPPDRITQDKGYRFWRKGPTGSDFIHEDVTPNFFRRSIEYIKQRSSEEQPFFLYLALPSPHTPILPTEEWLGKSELNPYGDFMLQVDDYMGQLLKAIDESGIGNNTLVVFTSDNGCSPKANFEVLEEKGHDPSYIFRGHKADIFEGGHRVPFIVKWPAGVKAGTESSEVICTTDLFRTFASLTGYNTGDDEGEDSYDISGLFSEPAPEMQLREATVHHSINGSFAIRKGDWKLIMCPGSGGWSFPRPGRDTEELAKLPDIQLYNLKDDPGESNNLQAQETEKVEELKALLTRYINDGRSTPGQVQSNDSISSKWKQVDFAKML